MTYFFVWTPPKSQRNCLDPPLISSYWCLPTTYISIFCSGGTPLFSKQTMHRADFLFVTTWTKIANIFMWWAAPCFSFLSYTWIVGGECLWATYVSALVRISPKGWQKYFKKLHNRQVQNTTIHNKALLIKTYIVHFTLLHP